MIRGLLMLGVFLLCLHVGYLFTSPVIKNTMLEGKMQDLASNRGLKTEAELRREVMEFVTEKEIALEPEAVWIQITDGRASIAASYSTEVTFWFYTRQYEFSAASSEGARTMMARHRRSPYHARS